jgi:hypothetical protein
MITNIPKKPHPSDPQQSAEVDSWADVKKTLDPAKLAFFEGAGKLIGSVPNQTPAISEFQDPSSDKYWLVSSLRTGYAHASMIRAQVLHLGYSFLSKINYQSHTLKFKIEQKARLRPLTQRVFTIFIFIYEIRMIIMNTSHNTMC